MNCVTSRKAHITLVPTLTITDHTQSFLPDSSNSPSGLYTQLNEATHDLSTLDWMCFVDFLFYFHYPDVSWTISRPRAERNWNPLRVIVEFHHAQTVDADLPQGRLLYIGTQ
jgi:hypothetical protein